MTKDQWNKSSDIFPMLMFAKMSDRKMRLYGCACCRHMWFHLSHSERRNVVAAELYADKRISLNKMLRVREYADSAPFYVCYNLIYTPYLDNLHYIMNALQSVLDFVALPYIGNFIDRRQLERQWQADMLRHMVKYERIKHAID
jgi:hypothetical protein